MVLVALSETSDAAGIAGDKGHSCLTVCDPVAMSSTT